ncbi:hypothetical protein DXG01_003674 [Tephrocybe rancida]|nr:hypothetical protein DXG01_003674 [Tephrocybe rancida]
MPTRGQQPATIGLGVAFTSPKKCRDKLKTSTLVNPFGCAEEILRLRATLNQLKKKKDATPIEEDSVEAVEQPVLQVESPAEIPEPEAPWDTSVQLIVVDDPLPTSPEFVSSIQHPWPPHHIKPNQSTQQLSLGEIPKRVVELTSRCDKSGHCTKKTNLVLCLFQDYFEKLSVNWCECEDLIQVLVSNGLFPTAPLASCISVSIHLLDFYRALFERSCDAIHAMANTLNTFYEWRGFILLNKKGTPIQDAFRRGLGYMAQWYDNLVLCLEKCVEDVIVKADAQLRENDPLDIDCDHFPLPAALDTLPLSISQEDPLHEPSENAQDLRKVKKPRWWQAVVPDEAIDGCQSSHTAGHGSNVKMNMERFDDGGLMAFRSRRIYIVDHHVGSIGEELRDDLGAWLRCWLNKGVQIQGQKACKILAELDIEEAVLRHEWSLQRASELLVRTCGLSVFVLYMHVLTSLTEVPIRPKKELNMVLSLQGDLDACEKSLQATCLTLSKTLGTPDSLRILRSVQNYHEQAQDHIEELYASLSIQDSFPKLHGVDLEFLQKLLVAHNLKINVQKRAIGSFFEWDWLDQASSGAHQTLGTKLHQQTHAAIKKQTPVLMAGLQKYNNICSTLASTYNPEWEIPLPEPLPTELKLLRECPHLMQDIWISCPMEQVPCWLKDQDVQEGIHAVLKVDRCHEEQCRLATEATNLSQWYGRELAAVELALEDPHSPLLPQHVFEAHTKRASIIARTLAMHMRLGTMPMPDYQPVTHKHTTYVDDDDFAQDNTKPVTFDEDILTANHWSMAGKEQETLVPTANHLDRTPN